MTQQKLTLYTNRKCPFARRVHATLKELSLEYEEVFIDLNTPRPQWYLDINPRGLVPTLKFGNEIITESSIVCEFLVDAFSPNHILPPPTTPENALFRARAKWFVDTYNTKAISAWFKVIFAPTEQLPEAGKVFVDIIEKEVEPYLASAKPFFGGSDKLTWVEIQLGSFLILPKTFSSEDAGQLLVKEQYERLKALKNFGPWLERVTEHPTILEVFEREEIVKGTFKRRANALAAAAEK